MNSSDLNLADDGLELKLNITVTDCVWLWACACGLSAFSKMTTKPMRQWNLVSWFHWATAVARNDFSFCFWVLVIDQSLEMF